jgi:uncharacterized membrane protein
MYPKGRMEALTDGLFAVAMTILVIDLKLPDDFQPANQDALARALIGLWPKFFPYAVSFYVLGSNWAANTRLRSRGEFVNRTYMYWWLVYLLLATCIPFSTTLVGRFVHLSLSAWVYCLNMAAFSGVGYLLVRLTPGLDEDEHVRDRRISLFLLIATSALCAGLSLIDPAKALWVYAFNVATPLITPWIRKMGWA